MRATGVVALAVLFAAAPASAQVFRSGVDMVSLGVTVADKAGSLVTGLTPEDFAIFEDGVRQDVRLFVDGQTAEGDRPPLHIGLLFDTSGSMVDDLAMARTAAIRFCNVLSLFIGERGRGRCVLFCGCTVFGRPHTAAPREPIAKGVPSSAQPGRKVPLCPISTAEHSARPRDPCDISRRARLPCRARSAC